MGGTQFTIDVRACMCNMRKSLLTLERTLSDANALISRIRREVPVVEPVYQEHLTDYDEVLAHVLMADIRRLAVRLHADALGGSADAHQQLTQLLALLEEGMQSPEEDVQELIAVSFLENLDRDDPQFSDLRNRMSPALSAELDSLDRDTP